MADDPQTGLLPSSLDEWRAPALRALAGLYGYRAQEVFDAAVARARAAHDARSPALRELDARRTAEPDWYQRPERVGYAAYVDRFGGDLAGVGARIPYLRELGVDVVHLMSVLRPRPGDNDGGYAIDDYRNPDPRLGTADDLRSLIDDLRAAGISTCIDLVMNHTSSTHEWARRAKAGSDYHRRLYRTFPDRTLPDAYEATLPEVFPTMAPGNFTWDDDLDAWVWTTFREFQWDLDWSNPDVFLGMLDVALHLANLGAEVLRLDAVAFTWKRIGTNCQNQPEAHLVAQALRAVLGIAAPATILLAEAIVGPDDLVAYLGAHETVVRECELAYHNQLMVQSWSMLAEGRAALATEALRRLPHPPSHAAWLTYVRCHDDIGWAIGDRDAARIGLDPFAHRRFLAAFYRGDYWESFARGVPFSSNDETGDERTCGTAAALCGIPAGEDDPSAAAPGLARLGLLYGIAFGYGGIPMIYMGDELALGDDVTYLDDPSRAADSRWRHRPWFDDDVAARRHGAGITAAAWSMMTRLVRARRECLALHGSGTTRPLRSGHEAVFAWHRLHPAGGDLLGVANVSRFSVRVDAGLFGALNASTARDLLAPDDTDLTSVAPWQVRWLVPS